MKNEIEKKLATLKADVTALIATDSRYAALAAHLSACKRIMKEIETDRRRSQR